MTPSARIGVDLSERRALSRRLLVNEPLDIEVRYGTYSPHLRPVIAGLLSLVSSGIARVTLSPGVGGLGGAVVSAVVEGREVIYDINDGYTRLDSGEVDTRVYDSVLAEADLYFKVNCTPSLNSLLSRPELIRPLGPLSTKFATRDVGLVEVAHALHRPYRGRPTAGALALAGQVMRLRRRELLPESYQVSAPRQLTGLPVVFLAGVWDPDAAECTQDWKRQDRSDINRFRMQLVRGLRDALGPKYVGGIMPSPFSRRLCPDLVYDGVESGQLAAYWRLLHASSIAVATRGLHGTCSAKIGEGLASAAAVVSQTQATQFPPPVDGDVPVIQAESPDDVVAAVVALLDDADGLHRVAHAGYRYYLDDLRPQAMACRTLDALLDTN